MTTIRQRLAKVEKRLSVGRTPEEQEAIANDAALRADTAAIAAYFSGKGPPPPEPRCPRWMDPEEHFRNYRMRLCHLMRRKGDLKPNECLPGMTEDERRRLDLYQLAWDVMEWAMTPARRHKGCAPQWTEPEPPCKFLRPPWGGAVKP